MDWRRGTVVLENRTAFDQALQAPPDEGEVIGRVTSPHVVHLLVVLGAPGRRQMQLAIGALFQQMNVQIHVPDEDGPEAAQRGHIAACVCPLPPAVVQRPQEVGGVGRGVGGVRIGRRGAAHRPRVRVPPVVQVFHAPKVRRGAGKYILYI